MSRQDIKRFNFLSVLTLWLLMNRSHVLSSLASSREWHLQWWNIYIPTKKCGNKIKSEIREKKWKQKYFILTVTSVFKKPEGDRQVGWVFFSGQGHQLLVLSSLCSIGESSLIMYCLSPFFLMFAIFLSRLLLLDLIDITHFFFAILNYVCRLLLIVYMSSFLTTFSV